MAQAASSDSQAIQEAVGKVQECFDQLNSVRSNMQGYAEEAAAKWQGQSAQVFKRVMETSDEKLDRIGQALEDLGQKMSGAALAYNAGEEENASVTSNIENLLSGL